MKAADVRVTGAQLYFLPVETRVPLKFGTETLTSVTCARVRLTVENREGKTAEGWGETPLSVQWAWPSATSYAVRHEAMKEFCRRLGKAWAGFDCWGHALEVGHAFNEEQATTLRASFNVGRAEGERVPLLAALVCASAFDIALHDAYGKVAGRPVYETYNAEFLNRDLSHYLTPAEGSNADFRGKYPQDFFVAAPPKTLPVWHLVGGLDPLEAKDVSASAPRDGHPNDLRAWIKRDGLKCLKIKLRGNDLEWDYARIVAVGKIGREEGSEWLTADFNCTVDKCEYVLEILDRLERNESAIYAMLLYAEQPFDYDMEANPIDAHSISARKPLLMDESADSWKHVRLGRSLGWDGVALKTCKTQTGALLSLCWAKAHGMHLMVQDLTNPMLAQVPHVLLAAHAGTMMGVESNAMQFYPDASAPEAKIHPGLFQRRNGLLDLSTIRGPGFGYRVEEIERTLPAAER